MEHRFADEGSDAEAQVQRQREQVERLASPGRRGDVGPGREHGHEEERLTDPEDPARDHEQGKRVDDEMERQRRDRQQRAADQQGSPAESIGGPTDDWTHDQGRGRERPERQAGTSRVGPERPDRERPDDGQDDPTTDEEHEGSAG